MWDFSPGLRDGPYVMPHVTQDAACGRILRVTTDGGRVTPAEIAFPPMITAPPPGPGLSITLPDAAPGPPQAVYR